MWPSLRRPDPVAFQFLDPGPLVDGDLELIPPHPDRIDDVLAACAHPLTRRDDPVEARITRSQLQQSLKIAPLGHEPGDASVGRVPSYHFWMYWREPASSAIGLSGTPLSPPVKIAGGITLRVGSTPPIEQYYGHVGYHVYPPARGHHFAERACRLLLPLARAHGMPTLWITCNPDNHPSRRTCERLGATLVEIIPIPKSQPLYTRGDREKCRYRLDLW